MASRGKSLMLAPGSARGDFMLPKWQLWPDSSQPILGLQHCGHCAISTLSCADTTPCAFDGASKSLRPVSHRGEMARSFEVVEASGIYPDLAASRRDRGWASPSPEISELYTHIVHDAGIADDLVARKCTSASINVCMRVCRQDIVKQNPLAACLSPCLHTHPRLAGRVTR